MGSHGPPLMSEGMPVVVKRPERSESAVSYWTASLPAAIWVAIAVTGVFGRTLFGIGGSWFDDKAEMGHGVFVPFAAAYMVWIKRDSLKRMSPEPSAWGLVVVGWGVTQSIIGIAAQWVWISRTAVLIVVIGCLLSLYGFRVLFELAYPILTLFLMIAPPTFIFERITLPLQLLASRLGEVVLELLGYSVFREGNILELVGEKLAVEEACSGIRSLVALLFLCVVYSFFFVPESVIRGILVAAVVPIAILCNAGRIIATGVVGQYNRDLAHGMLHEAFGHVGLILGAVLCLLLHHLIRKLPGFRPRYA